MNSYKKLLKNIIVFGLGSLGSKIISFLLVPLYTYYLSQSEYGNVDLVLVTVSMLLPIISSSIHQAVLRFIIDKTIKLEMVMTNAITISFVGYFVFLLTYPILNYFKFLDGYLIYLYMLLFVQMINQLFGYFARGIGATKEYAVSGIIISFFIGFLSVLFLVKLKWRVEGYLIANIIAYVASTIYLWFSVKPLKNTNKMLVNTTISKVLLKFSVPLIPNSLMWWIINSSNKYIINIYVGVEGNGLYAVSSKIPSLISLVTDIFSQAWQLSAFEEYGEENSSSFYTKIFQLYSGTLLIVTSLIVAILKPAFSILFATEYFVAWKPVPFLLLGSVFSAFSGFIGVTYTASKNTKGVFKTSIYGGLISFIANLILVPRFGIEGAGISSMIGFFAMFIIRYFDTKNMLSINVSWKKLLISIIIILIQTLILFININENIEIISVFGLLVILIVINREVLSRIMSLIKIILNSKKTQ